MRDNIRLGGMFTVELKRDGKVIHSEKFHNVITTEGRDNILDVMFDAATQVTSWFVGLIDNAGYTGVSAADTHDSHTGWDENTDFDESTRPEWAPDAASSQSISNSLTVDFSINGTVTIKGIFVSGLNTKGSTSSAPLLWSAGAFATNVTAVNGDTLSVTYTVSD